MNGRKLVLVFAPALFIAAFGRAQNTLELKLTETVSVANHKADGILEPVKCDSHSNIYAQPFSGSGLPWHAPIVKLSPDGKATDFPLPRREGKTLEIMSFDPSVHGGVVMLTRDSDIHYYVETYDDRGEFESRFTLPAELHPMQIAAADGGKALVCGFYSSPGSPEVTPGTPGRPFAGLFGPSGALEREVLLTEDEGEGGNKKSATTDAGAKPVKSLSSSSSAIQSSADGNFVLSRISAGGPIYVVSPAGFALESFDPPTIPGAQLYSVRVAANYLAALYIKKKAGSTQNEITDIFISLLDSQTGEEQVRFHHSSWELGAGLACYDKGVFTFLTTGDDGDIEVVRAK